MYYPIYKFTLAQDNQTPQDCHPLWSNSLALEYNKESGEEFFRKKLSGEFTFVGPDCVSILEASFDTKFTLGIQISYNGGSSWLNYLSCFFYKIDCKFDEDAQKITVSPSTNDTYDKLLEGIDKEYNLTELLPEISKIQYDKRGLLQIYSRGDSVISCFLSGMWWEQSCNTVTSESDLAQTYKFARLVDQAYYVLSGEVNEALLTPLDGWEFNQEILEEDPDIHEYYWLTELINEDTGSRWYEEQWTESTFPPSLPLTLNPDTETQATSPVTIQREVLSLWGRLIIDLPTIQGFTIYPIPTEDLVENNRNYHYVSPFDDDTGIVFNDKFSSSPTEWGIYQPGRYYKKPYSPGITSFCPVCRSTWTAISVWYASSILDSLYDQATRKTVTLNDAYPLYSVISVLLNKILGSGVLTHGNSIDYSRFLYGVPYDSSMIKQGNWRLFITPKSNILNSGYDQPAQKAPITLRRIFDMLRDCFRCFWFIDGNKLRIEHIEYFRKGGRYSGNPVVGIDLTQREELRNSKTWDFAKNQYSFSKPELASRYEFGWMDDVTDVFEGIPIDITSPYASQGKVEKITINDFTSDIDYMVLNPAACSQDGFALIAAIQNSNAWKIPYFSFANLAWQNGYLAFRLLTDYYLYDMPTEDAEQGGSPLRVQGTKKLKIQEVVFPTVRDPATNFLIKTQLGNGEIEKLSINLSSRTVKATLRYDTE